MSEEMRYLNVYLKDIEIGRLYSDKGELSFAYNEDYASNEDNLKLSASLPLQKEVFGHQEAYTFFSGLIPEGELLENLVSHYKLSKENVFEILKILGRDCAGAVSLYPDGVTPKTVSQNELIILDDDKADELLSSMKKYAQMVEEYNVCMSPAGVQNKLTAVIKDGKIALPVGNTPSTHIIKPNIKPRDGKSFKDSVFNEFFCMKLAKAVGLNVPEVDIMWVKDNPYYLIERYDRVKNFEGIFCRLHQEDFCQALGFVSKIKYENESGPSIKSLLSLMGSRSQQGSMAGVNKLKLLHVIIFNFIIGNGDAHGKNFSLLYKNQAEELAPFYDLMCSSCYDDNKMSMKIGGRYDFDKIFMRHFDKLAEENGYKPVFVRKQIADMIKKVKKHSLALCDKYKETKYYSPIYDEILKGIEIRASQIIED